MAVEGRKGSGARLRSLAGGFRGPAGTLYGDSRSVARGPGRTPGVTEDTVGKWLKGVEPTGGNVWAMFQLSRGVPGGFELLLHGYSGDQDGAEQ